VLAVENKVIRPKTTSNPYYAELKGCASNINNYTAQYKTYDADVS
jgi:hypothetical protein